MLHNVMKNSPDVPASPAEAHGFNSLIRFWVCFLVCLGVVGLISGLMLVGLFLIMGYKIL